MRVLTTPPTCDTHELVRAQCQVAHHAARGVFQLRRPLHEELGLAQRRETDGRESDGRVVGAIHVNGSRLCGFGCATALFHSLGCRFASKMNISATSSSSSAPSSWICPSAGWNLLAATFGCVLRPCCSEPSGLRLSQRILRSWTATSHRYPFSSFFPLAFGIASLLYSRTLL